MADQISNGSPAAEDKRAAIVKAALETWKAAAGKGYLYGGKTTAGFDCSGFVSYVYQQVLPQFSYLDTSHIENGPLFIETKNPQPGDVIFFSAGQNPYEVKRKNKRAYPAHVGIVLDSNTWIGSQSSTGVSKVSMDNSWWTARTFKFLRYSGISP